MILKRSVSHGYGIPPPTHPRDYVIENRSHFAALVHLLLVPRRGISIFAGRLKSPDFPPPISAAIEISSDPAQCPRAVSSTSTGNFCWRCLRIECPGDETAMPLAAAYAQLSMAHSRCISDQEADTGTVVLPRCIFRCRIVAPEVFRLTLWHLLHHLSRNMTRWSRQNR